MRGDERVDNEDGARALVADILDARRVTSLVAICLSEDRTEPLVDVDALRASLGTSADVRIIRTGSATWALKRLLPRGLDVFGDAVRIWRPGALEGATHPLVLLREGLEVEALGPRIHDLVGVHRIQPAVVMSVSGAGAMLLLADGGTVAVDRHQVTRHDLPVDRVLRTAQSVQALLIGTDPVWATLRPMEPTPRERLAVHYGPGTILLGRSLDQAASGDGPVELLPGVHGLVPAHVMPDAAEWNAGDVIAVEVVDADLRLALRPSEVGAHGASLFPGGPSWVESPPLAAELPALGPPRGWPATSKPRRAPSDTIEPADDLAGLVLDASRAHQDARALIVGVDDEVARLRAEAAALRHELEMDLVDLRQRVMAALEDERDASEQLMLDAFESARAEIVRLRSLLADSDGSRRTLRRELTDLRAAEREHRSLLAEARKAAQLEREKSADLQRELDSLVPPETRFTNAVRQAWLRQTSKADRVDYPWIEPIIGEHFLPSVQRLEGVGVDRVVEVCAEVVCGRATERAGFQVHPLRWSAGGGSGQRTRADGARAFRASLQVRSAAARRLHYWKLSDGRVELAQIGYHDDFTIS